MRLTFLGTGTSQGVPVIGCRCAVCRSGDHRDCRLRTAAMLTTGEGANLLFDIGPDFRQQMLRHDVTHLEAILVTHAHRDHVGGLDDVRALNYLQHSSMEVYLNAVAATALRRDYAYIFAPHDYPGLPEVNLHVAEGPFVVDDVTVMPIALMHKDLPILGYRIGSMAYLTDVNYIPPESMVQLDGVDTLVINALRKEKHWSHFCLTEALAVIKQLRPARAYLTHISHEMGLHADVQAELPENVFLAYDNLQVEL